MEEQIILDRIADWAEVLEKIEAPSVDRQGVNHLFHAWEEYLRWGNLEDEIRYGFSTATINLVMEYGRELSALIRRIAAAYRADSSKLTGSLQYERHELWMLLAETVETVEPLPLKQKKKKRIAERSQAKAATVKIIRPNQELPKAARSKQNREIRRLSPWQRIRAGASLPAEEHSRPEENPVEMQPSKTPPARKRQRKAKSLSQRRTEFYDDYQVDHPEATYGEVLRQWIKKYPSDAECTEGAFRQSVKRERDKTAL